MPVPSGPVKTDASSSLVDTTAEGIDHNALVARNIRRYREERKLSLGELARLAHLSKQTLSKIEIGTGNPTVGTIGAIADALGLSVRTLLTEWGSPIRTSRAADADWAARDNCAAERTLDTIYGSGDVRTWLLRLDPTDSRPGRAGAVVRCDPSAPGTLHHCYLISGSARIGPDGDTVELDAGDFVRFPGDTRHVFQGLVGGALLHIVTTVPGVPQFRPIRDASR